MICIALLALLCIFVLVILCIISKKNRYRVHQHHTVIEPIFIVRPHEAVQDSMVEIEVEDNLQMARAFKNESKDAPQALHHYLVAFQKHGYEDAVIEIAELYAYGLHPNVPPEKILAGRIFNYICHDQDFSQRAKDYAKYVLHNITPLMYNDIDRIQDSFSYLLPTNIVELISKIHPITLVPTEQHAPMVIVDDTDNDAIVVMTSIIVNDSQNVHDSELQNAAKKNIDTLSPSDDDTDHIHVLRTTYQTHPKLSNMDKQNISLVLDSINDTNVHSKYGKTEMQILNAIWNRIHSDVNKTNKDELVLALADQLASAVEHGTVVCSTGKIMRIVSSLEAIDMGNDMAPLKPKWAIEREIAEAAIQVRNSVLSSRPRHVVDAYNEGENEELADMMRDMLTQKCHVDYVKPGIINNEEALRFILQPFLDSF